MFYIQISKEGFLTYKQIILCSLVIPPVYPYGAHFDQSTFRLFNHKNNKNKSNNNRTKQQTELSPHTVISILMYRTLGRK